MRLSHPRALWLLAAQHATGRGAAARATAVSSRTASSTASRSSRPCCTMSERHVGKAARWWAKARRSRPSPPASGSPPRLPVGRTAASPPRPGRSGRARRRGHRISRIARRTDGPPAPRDPRSRAGRRPPGAGTRSWVRAILPGAVRHDGSGPPGSRDRRRAGGAVPAAARTARLAARRDRALRLPRAPSPIAGTAATAHRRQRRSPFNPPAGTQPGGGQRRGARPAGAPARGPRG